MVRVETKTAYKLKCKLWERQYCMIGWVLDEKAGVFVFQFSFFFSFNVTFFFYIKSFSIINRSLFLFYFFQDLSSIAFISSKNLVVVGSMTGLIGWVLLSAALSLFNLQEGRQ